MHPMQGDIEVGSCMEMCEVLFYSPVATLNMALPKLEPIIREAVVSKI